MIIGAVLFAVVADLAADGPVRGGAIYLLAMLPGLITYLAFRTLVASAFVSFAPLYFVIGDLTRNRPEDWLFSPAQREELRSGRFSTRRFAAPRFPLLPE